MISHQPRPVAELETLILEKVAAGGYRDASELVADAISLLDEGSGGLSDEVHRALDVRWSRYRRQAAHHVEHARGHRRLLQDPAKPVVLSLRADADVARIRIEGVERRVKRSDRCLDDLRRRLRSLAAHPEHHSRVGPSRPAMRRARFGSHIVFYREEQARVLVVRILHERMEHTPRL